MTKEYIYTYLGTNGTITSPVYLEGIYSVKKIRLIADKNKQLTTDGKNFYDSILINEVDLDKWYEISK